MANPLRIDPSRTGDIRRAALNEIRQRFRDLQTTIIQHVLKDNGSGLDSDRTVITLNAYEFSTTDDKLKAFQQWLLGQVTQKILGADTFKEPWTDKYIDSAYRRGIARAWVDTHKDSHDLTKPAGFIEGSKAQFLRQTFANPERTSKIKLLATRDFAQLKGITDSMSSKMSTIFADGVANGHGAQKVAKALVNQVGIDKLRAERLARTEIIHVHADGQLDGYQELGVEEVGIKAEILTAGDERVCPICSGKEGKTYTIEQARNIIPLHPNCRCAWMPSTKYSRNKKASSNGTRPTLTGKLRPAKSQPLQAPAAGLWGMQPTAVVRWMGQEGWSFDEAKTALEASGVSVADNTLKIQLRAGKQGDKSRGEPAMLTTAQVAELNARKAGSVVPPPKPPPPVVPPIVPPVVVPPIIVPPVVPPKPPVIVPPPVVVKPPVIPPVVPPTGGVEKPAFNHSGTALVRALGKQGYSFDETKNALAAAGIDLGDSTIRIQLRAGKTGERGAPAELTPAQIAFLEQSKKGGIVITAKSPAVVKPPVVEKKKPELKGKPDWITYTGEANELATKVWGILGDKPEWEPAAAVQKYREVGKVILEEIKKSPALSGLQAAYAKWSDINARDYQAYTDLGPAQQAASLKMDEIASRLGPGQSHDNPEYLAAEKIYSDLMRQRNALRDSWTKAYEEQKKARKEQDSALRAAALDTLKKVRDFGNGPLNYAKGSQKKVIKYVNDAADKLPADWVKGLQQAEFDVSIIKRGHFLKTGPNKADVKLSEDRYSGSEENQDKYLRGVAVHELTHAVEAFYRPPSHAGMRMDSAPQMGLIEEAFVKSRIRPGEQPIHIPGDVRTAIAYKDEFKELYAGRVYRGDESTHWEVSTMGVEGTVEQRYSTFEDEDYAHFILGMMAGH